MILIQNPDNNQQIDFIIQQICEANTMTREVLNSRFNIFVISQEQLDAKLLNSSKYFRIHPQEDINIFIMFVKVE
jgi:hypothetical protein